MRLVVQKSCIPVRGYSRSSICDLRRHKIKLIPNSLYEILDKYQGKSIEQIKKKYDKKHHNTIDEYLDFLIINEFIFFSDHHERFPRINTDYLSPSEITNAIVDFDKSYDIEYIKIILNELSSMLCLSVQIRFFNEVENESLIKILKHIKTTNSNITSVEIILKDDYEENYLINLIDKFPRLMKIIAFSSDKESVVKSKINDNAFLIYTKKNIISEKNCGLINQKYFSVNISSFTEGLNHNSCLNQKISINKEGNIKNCPSMPQSFGNIKDTSLKEALNHKDFKKYWNLTKDQIDVCKDCEFRYVCTDCRAYVEEPENNYSKPLKCGYNPYSNEWEEWSKNPLKQTVIEYYGMQELVEKND